MDKEKGQEYRKLFPFKILHQGQSAELIAEKWNISKEEVDRFSGASHEKCAAATEKGIDSTVHYSVSGYFKREIIPITLKKPDGNTVVMDRDEGIRVPVDYKKLASLKSIFKENG